MVLYFFTMNKTRCAWCGTDSLYIKYHDEEWGVPVYDDKTLFEFLILETFQAGLSWITVLKKRENFREAFDNFEYKKIANYSEEKYEELLQNAGIIRNKLKIKATISNATAFMKIQKEFPTKVDGFRLDIVRDSGKPIQDNVDDVKETILIGVILTVIVVFFFLGLGAPSLELIFS